MIDTQLRFKRAASVRSAPGSEPSHIHIVRPSHRRRPDAAELPVDALPELTDVGAVEAVEEAA
jgi:hypothetical protein